MLTSDVNKATTVKNKAMTTISEAKANTNYQGHDHQNQGQGHKSQGQAVATCCHSTVSARQLTRDESIFTKLSNTRNLFNNGEQSVTELLLSDGQS